MLDDGSLVEGGDVAIVDGCGDIEEGATRVDDGVNVNGVVGDDALLVFIDVCIRGDGVDGAVTGERGRVAIRLVLYKG